MMILRMSIFVLSITFSASAFSQTDQQSTYQCSSGTSLKDGYLVYTAGGLLAVAKHRDGKITEINGILGLKYAKNDSMNEILRRITYVELAQINAKLDQLAKDDPEAVKDISQSDPRINALALILNIRAEKESSAPIVEPQARPGDTRELLPGQKVSPRAGDLVSAFKAGDATFSGETSPMKNGSLVMSKYVTTFSARLDSQGQLNQIAFRKGTKNKDGATVNPDDWRAGAKNSDDSQRVYGTLNSELDNLKTRAYCCTQNPGANCRISSDRLNAQASLRTVKPAGKEEKANWSNSSNASGFSSSSSAK